MTERQGRLVTKIQGYEGKDQKTSQSLSSVCSWVPRRESEASKRWEESWWWGDRSSSSPGQWQNSNYRQWWHVMESFTLQLYRKRSGQNTCINTLCDGRNRGRKEGWKASSATTLSPCLCYQEWGQPKAREAERCVPLQGTSELNVWWPGSPWVLDGAQGCSCKAEPSSHTAGACKITDQCWMLQQWPRNACIYFNL